MNKHEREIEMLNDPKPMVFIGDMIIKGIIYSAAGVVAGFIGWLALVGLDNVFQNMGI